MQGPEVKERQFPFALVLTFVVVVVGVIAAGYFYYRQYERQYRLGVDSKLLAIATLKTDDLATWRRERLGDASVFFQNKLFTGLVRRFLDNPDDLEARTTILDWTGRLDVYGQYDRINLLDAQGAAILSASPESTSFPSTIGQCLFEALGTGQVKFQDFYRDEHDQKIYLALLVPVIDAENGKRPLGALFLRIDPEKYLYPFIERWPTANETAETLLVRKDGGDVLYLNELKYDKNAALTLRIPLKRTDLPAVKAVSGQAGIVEGVDYRGTPVVADVRPVPDSPWFLIARMDRSEIYGPIRERLLEIILIVVALLFGAGAFLAFLWRQQRVRYFRQRYESAAALRETTSYLDNLINHANVPIIVWDPQFRITRFNGAFESLTGRSAGDVLGKDIGLLFPPTQAARSMEFIRNTQSGARWETVEIGILHLDGTVRTVLWNSATIFAADGRSPMATIAQGHDITKRKQAESSLQAAYVKLEALWNITSLAAANTKTVSDHILESITRMTGSGYGFYGFISDDESVMTIHAWSGEAMKDCSMVDRPTCFLISEAGVWGEAVRRGEPLVINDYSAQHVGKKGLPAGHVPLTNLLVVPFMSGGKITSVAAVANSDAGYDPDDISQITAFLNSIQAITDSKRAEERLRESEEKFRAIANYTVDWESWFGPDGRYVWVNPAVEKITGYTAEEVLAMPDFISVLIAEEDRDAFKAHFQDSLHGARGEDFEFRYIHKNGLKHWLSASWQPIYDAAGQFLGTRSSGRDITTRKQAEDALRESEERFRKIFEDGPVGIALLNTDFQFSRVNASFAAMLGYSPQEMQLLTFPEITHPEDAKKDVPNVRRLIAGDLDTYRTEKRYITKTGETVWGSVYVSMIWGKDGEATRILAMVDDITERKRAEEDRERLEVQLRQAQKMEAVGQLAGGVAHDFNNLLQVILGYVDIVRNDIGPDTPNGQALADVHTAAERAADLTRQLLAFSRRQIIQPVSLDMNELVQGVLKMIRRVIGEHINLCFIPGSGLGTIRADKGQMEQILMNLCVNARDAMPQGGTLTIMTRNAIIDESCGGLDPLEAPGDYVQISVTDTGCGMDKETRAQIFEPFFTTKDVGQGTGLGLATVYGIIKQHNGMVNVYSEPDKGTVFNIYLPVVEQPEADAAADAEPPVTGGIETILLAEDEKMVRDLVGHMLRDSGYSVLTACDGEDALRIFEEQAGSIDLLLLDVMMPNLGGHEVMARIQAAHPKARFLFSSGYSEDAIHTNFVIKEGLHLINKPYRRTELLRAIREVLDKP